MTPERIARIRKSFTCADMDDLCDEVLSLQTALVLQMEKYLAEKNLVIAQDIQIEKLTTKVQRADKATKILTSILTRCPQPTEEVDDTIREAIDCLVEW